MKNILIALITLMGVNDVLGQNPTVIFEDWDGVTPCFTSWSPAGSFQGFDGHDITGPVYNPAESRLEINVKTHGSQHGPLYYTFSKGDEVSCEAGKGLVDVTGINSRLGIRAKSTDPVQVIVYVNEGNDASWDYTKLSAKTLTLNLTSEYQEFTFTGFDSNAVVGGGKIDLTNIGGLAFELGKSDGVNYDEVDTKIFIDYIKVGTWHIDSCWECNGVSELEIVPLTIFPNPSTGVFQVELDPIKTTKIEITDVNGRVLAEKISIGESTVTFSETLPKGVYFVKATTDEGVGLSKLVVK